jgi:ADP-ribosylglycohydrolase
LGCLLGGALGDAFGYVVEFDSLESIRARHGADGLREPVLRAGRLQVSDDTQMTLFTLEGLVRAREAGATDAHPFLREAYLDWWLTQQPGPAARWPFAPHGMLALVPELQACRAPGLTCLKAMADGGWGTLGRPANDSKGCGAVMRSAPVGFDGFGAAGGAAVPSRALLAAEAGAITHGHPESGAACAVMAALVQSLFEADHAADAASEVGPLRQALIPARHQATVWQAAAPLTSRRMDQAIALAAQRAPCPAEEANRVALLGGGWVAEEALAIGLMAALAGDDFTHALRIAANHDGDSDSTASLAGQLRGAARGVADLPIHWVMKLDVLEPLLALAARA